MEQNKSTTFSVEYELGGVTFFKNVSATSMEDAKIQIQGLQTNATIRSISIVGDDGNEHYAG